MAELQFQISSGGHCFVIPLLSYSFELTSKIHFTIQKYIKYTLHKYKIYFPILYISILVLEVHRFLLRDVLGMKLTYYHKKIELSSCKVDQVFVFQSLLNCGGHLEQV